MSETIGDVSVWMRSRRQFHGPQWKEACDRLEAAARTAPERVFDLDRGDGLPPDGGPLHEWLYLRAELGLEDE